MDVYSTGFTLYDVYTVFMKLSANGNGVLSRVRARLRHLADGRTLGLCLIVCVRS
jgi:hypothetical protein